MRTCFRGGYWEAHELWEKLWNAADRRGTTATFLKALIQLAVVGVKALEGRADGARAHAERAAELFREVTSDCKATTFAGLELSELIATAESAPLRLTLDWKSS